MPTRRLGLSVILALSASAFAQSDAVYYPGAWNDWETRTPAQAGMDAAALQAAVDHALANETQRPRDIRATLNMVIGREPFGEITGPTRPRGGLNGIIVKDGYIVAEWGDTRRVDMTFSVTKTYLSTTAALALKHGLIRDVHDRVADYVQDGGFEVVDDSFYGEQYEPPEEWRNDIPPDHNTKITWHMLLNQTSQWHGTLFGKPDWADRFDGELRPYHAPGTNYRYNDVRVNRLALALLQAWRRPLPQVLKEEVMDPIGASPTWHWYGYENSWVTIDGAKLQSVSGGGHWGGGMHISTRDHARFGLLMLRRGNWKGEQLVPAEWYDMASAPGDINDGYGYMNWYLNHDGERYPSAPKSTITFLGSGTNMIWLDPEHDLVSVVRWIDDGAVDEYMRLVLASIE